MYLVINMTIDEIIRELDENLTVIKIEKSDKTLYIKCEIKCVAVRCIYCGEESTAIHSRYERNISDLPIQDYQVKLIVKVPKFFCHNEKCSHKTFAYPISFAARNSLRTERLDEYIYKVGLKNSSMDARAQLLNSHVSISNNTILRVIKKNKANHKL